MTPLSHNPKPEREKLKEWPSLLADASVSDRQLKKWRQYLANERAEAAVYRELARRRTGEERDILLTIANAEARHEQYWCEKLGDEIGMPLRPDLSTRIMGFLAQHFGSVFVLALMQSAESRSPYSSEEDATCQMRADERIHAEVVRGLAARSRERMSGTFRAAIFGLNDGLVSNLALVCGVVGSGVSPKVVLLTGIAGLLAGALSMATGEFVSVSSQKELLEAAAPSPDTTTALPELDFDANELALVYRARGMAQDEAESTASAVLERIRRNARHEAEAQHPAPETLGWGSANRESIQAVGSGWTAAASSFVCFALGALIPILPFMVGLSLTTAAVMAIVLVGIVLMGTGSVVGVLSGTSPMTRGIRRLGIGLGAAAVTWLLGNACGAVLG